MSIDYRDFVPAQRFQPSTVLSPDGQAVAYSSNASGQFNLWIHPLNGDAPAQLTDFTHNAVREISWMPDGKSLIFTADENGDEQYQIYRVGADGGAPEPITTADGRQHRLGPAPLDAAGRYLAYTANDRDITVQELIVRDLESGESRRFSPPSGEMFMQSMISPDASRVVVAGVRSNTDVDAYLIELCDPAANPRRLTDGAGFYWPQQWAPEADRFYLTTMKWGEFIAAGVCSVDNGDIQPVARADWNVEHIAVAGELVVWTVNDAGRSVLHVSRDGRELALPELPTAVIYDLDVSPDGTLVVQIDAATRPTEIAVIGLSARCFRYLTDTRPPGLLTVEAVEPSSVAVPARDGRSIQTWIYRPHGSGPFPALMWIHGGPESQERCVYGRYGLYQYLLSQGIAIIGPNVAGSYGYGLSFQTAIYRDWGGIDLHDFDDVLTYLGSLDWLDASRVGVAGQSYGGFAALSCLSRIDAPWAAGVSICGPSNLVTLASACPPTWRGYVDRIIGNPERDVDQLTQRSPVTHADNITAPLHVVQGAHDPRVPQAESDQIVERLRSRGVEVRYDVYPDEGHGFTNRDNEIRAYTDIAEFLTGHLSGH